MILSELVSDAIKAGDMAGSFCLLLATRTVAGQELSDGQVQLGEAGLLQIDDANGEIDILPLRFMEGSPACLTVADVLAMLQERPEIGGFSLTGIEGFKELSDGGSAQKTLPVIGTYSLVEDGEIWLLLYPKEQWSQALFGSQ